VRHRRAWTSWTRLGIPLGLVLWAAPALAADPDEDAAPKTKRAVEILDHVDWERPSDDGKFDLSRFRIDTKRGLTYRRSAKLGNRPIELRVYGPVQRHTTFGLGFKIKF
jgi:hypothetical protein